MLKTIKEIGVLSVGFTLALIIFIGLSIANAAWINPPASPPAGNLGAPINTSATSQIKSGPLQVNGFVNIGGTMLKGTTNCAGKLYTDSLGKVLCGADATGALDSSSISSCTNSTTNKIYWNGSKLVCGTDAVGGSIDTSTFLNTSATGQIKSGALQVNGFKNIGATILNGSVGIGTVSPTQKLDVAGNIRATDVCTTAGKCLSASGGAMASYNDLPAGATAGWCAEYRPGGQGCGAGGVPSRSMVLPAACSGNACACQAGWTRERTGIDVIGTSTSVTFAYFTCIKN